jgi:predicted metal-dependent phosphoesterase TrpH
MSGVQTVDLHCHSTISDGVLAPAELVARAAAKGVEILALTDHDDVSGLAEARVAAAGYGIRFIDGVEISVTWGNTAIHIVGLGIDPYDHALLDGLAAIRAGRDGRAQRMAAGLADIGIRGALAGAARHARNPTVLSRTHFARFLVEQGVAADVHGVFEHYLTSGKPGYVAHQWATLAQALAWIHGAGGVAVVAHPGRYRVSRQQLNDLLSGFKKMGGEAIEVHSGSQAREQNAEMARIARRFGFLASTASDFHAAGESPVDLGGMPPLPPDLTPVWSRLV